MPVTEFFPEALEVSLYQFFPVVFRVRGFDPWEMTRGLTSFTLNDQHTFCTSNDTHNSDGLNLRQVFNINNKKNMHHIEDDIYPEKTPPTIHTTDILNQS